VFGVDGLLAARDDELAGAEQERDDLGLVEAVDEAGELLGLVLDVLEAETDGDGVEVQLAAEVGRRDDVLDDDLGVVLHLDGELAELVEDDSEALVDVVGGLRAGADDLSGAEDECGALGVLSAVDEPRELLGVVVGALEVHRDALEVELLADAGGGDHVFNVDGFLGVGHRST